ncbi:MAG: hypothetical protein HY842_09430 [Bacteroidetes bacterium]|nr:hypothetical protein [Bacteroidota bacterium]
MNCLRLSICCVAILAKSSFLSAQINLKIDAVPGTANTWGIYTKTCEDVTPTANTITGSGQVTVIFPVGLALSNLTSHAGAWSQNAMVAAPGEAPDKVYVSLGFLVDNPKIIYQPDTETLLFSFKLNGSASGSPALIENDTDPFAQLPNSANSNPGNELTVLDFGTQPMALYSYVGNYLGNSNATACDEITPPDTTTIDTTIIDPPVDTTTIDTTIIDTTTVDTTIIDTTIIDPPVDTTQQTSGVFDPKKQEVLFKLYPTPTFDWLTVKFLSTKTRDGVLRLWTLNGIPLGQLEKGQNEILRLNVGELPPGLYFLTYEKSGKILQRERFLRQ